MHKRTRGGGGGGGRTIHALDTKQKESVGSIVLLVMVSFPAVSLFINTEADITQ